jgi:hypothetical protein
MEAAQMRFLRLLLDLTRPDRQRNPGIRNRLKVDISVEDVKLCLENWLNHLKGMDKSRLPKVAFQYQAWGRRDIGRPR